MIDNKAKKDARVTRNFNIHTEMNIKEIAKILRNSDVSASSFLLERLRYHQQQNALNPGFS